MIITWTLILILNTTNYNGISSAMTSVQGFSQESDCNQWGRLWELSPTDIPHQKHDHFCVQVLQNKP